MNMIEKMARAINETHAEWCINDQGSKSDLWVSLAKAAIEAMREPSEEMLEILRENGGIDGYQLMIDAALKE